MYIYFFLFEVHHIMLFYIVAICSFEEYIYYYCFQVLSIIVQNRLTMVIVKLKQNILCKICGPQKEKNKVLTFYKPFILILQHLK